MKITIIPFFLICILALLSMNVRGQGVPGIITFGDSAVDIGNNNFLLTIFKANYAPYGRDFPGHNATGRLCNGMLATDFIATALLGSKHVPAYLSPEATGNNLLNGANFASAGSGYDDRTALTSGALSLPAQISYFKHYRKRLAKVAGSTTATKIINGSLYLASFGSSDFIQNYYVNPLLHNAYSPNQYSDYLVSIFSNFIKDLYSLGARRIGVTSLPPIGYFPLVKTLFGAHKNGCVARINADTRGFNRRVNKSANTLKKQLPGLKLAILDIYTPLYNVTRYPASYGFMEAGKGCCGTGTIETTILLCNPLSLGTCSNATQYVFWDSIHPTQATNGYLADRLIDQGFELVR